MHKKTKAKIKTAIDKWLKPLGLLWWDIKIIYVDKEDDHKALFENVDPLTTTYAKVFPDWRYATARIYVNVTAFSHLSDDDVENTMLHELVHILVNEMREEGIDHEERVVTVLTKAFAWTRKDGAGTLQ